jgi:hypothetical protein
MCQSKGSTGKRQKKEREKRELEGDMRARERGRGVRGG